MTLPTSGPISLGQVRTELGGAGAQSLNSGSIALGVAATPNSMSELYGKSSGPVEFFLFSNGDSTSSNSCSFGGEFEEITHKASANPAIVGTIIYLANGITKFNGGNLWWNSGDAYTIRIGTTGIVTAKVIC